MALPVSITNLINRRVAEDDRIEYLRDYDPEQVLHTICAFANDIGNEGGGYIVIGMEEKTGFLNGRSQGLPKALLAKPPGRYCKTAA